MCANLRKIAVCVLILQKWHPKWKCTCFFGDHFLWNFFRQVWGNLGKNLSHPPKVACSYTCGHTWTSPRLFFTHTHVPLLSWIYCKYHTPTRKWRNFTCHLLLCMLLSGSSGIYVIAAWNWAEPHAAREPRVGKACTMGSDYIIWKSSFCTAAPTHNKAAHCSV